MTLNREARRAVAHGKVPVPPTPDGAGVSGQNEFLAALLEANRSDCKCKPCRLLRRMAGGLTDSLLPEEEEEAT